MLLCVLLALSLPPAETPVDSLLARPIDEVVIHTGRNPFSFRLPTGVNISQTQIERSAPQSVGQVLEQELPGFDYTLVEGQQAGISFQGLDASYLKILIDGRPMAGQTTRSNPDLGRIDIGRIRSIDLERTPAVVRYGSGAISGVIDIRTEQPEPGFHLDLDSRYDTRGEQSHSLGVGYGTGRLNARTSGSFRDAKRYFLTSRGKFSGGHTGAPPTPGEVVERVEIEGYRSYSVRQQLAYDLGEVRLAAYGEFYEHERKNAGQVGKRMHDLYRDINGGLEASLKLASGSDLRLSYDIDSYSKFNKYLRLDSLARNYRHTLHHPQLLYTRSGHTRITAGAELLAERLESYQFRSGQGGGAPRRDNWAAFALASWAHRNWQFSTGLRGDHYSDFGARLSPGISVARLSVLRRFNLRINYASAFRAPTLKELHTDWNHQGLFQLVGNPDLKPETSHHFSASIDYLSGGLFLSASAFHNRISDKIATLWSAAGDTLRYANVSSARVAGVTLTSRIEIGQRMDLRLNYAYTHDFQELDGKNISSLRPHSATGHLSYRLSSGEGSIDLGARWRSAIGQWATTTSGQWVRLRYPPYAILRLSASGKIMKGVRITAGIDNLLDYTPRHVTFNAGITPGRSYFLALALSL